MIVHKNPYFSVDYTDDYYSISFPTEQVLVLPIVDERKILFIKAIRPVFDEPVIELPAGTVEKGEALETAAIRELNEETGVNFIDYDRLSPFCFLNTIPSRTSQMLNIYRADITKDEYERRNNHDGEVAGTLLLSSEEVIQKIRSGEIFVATTVAVCLNYIISSISNINTLENK